MSLCERALNTGMAGGVRGSGAATDSVTVGMCSMSLEVATFRGAAVRSEGRRK